MDKALALDIAALAKRLHTEPPETISRQLVGQFKADAASARDAAVLILIVVRDHGHSIVFTKRTTRLTKHAGQVSFPGGKVDDTDQNHWQAACREAEEEIGVARHDITKLGYLPRCLTGSGFIITPCVGVIYEPEPFLPNDAEVDEVFEISLATLNKNDTYMFDYVEFGERLIKTWIVKHESQTIWGITAGLTRMFFDLALAPKD